MTVISKQRRRRMIHDLLDGQHDIAAFGRKHHLNISQLVDWIDEPDNQRVLRGMCVLADVQTQLLLSRYRSLAASRLIRLATEDEGSADVARRACVDLLKLEMKRANLGEATAQTVDAADSTLRDLLYAKAAEDAADA
jgi:transposase-like protein